MGIVPPHSQPSWDGARSRHGSHPTRTPSKVPTCPMLNSTPNTHLLTPLLSHHADLRSAVQELTTSWLAHDPPITGWTLLSSSSRASSLGVMALKTNQEEEEEEEKKTHHLAGTTRLLVEQLSSAHRYACRLADLRLCSLIRHAYMCLNAEPDISSLDGRRLRAICGTLCFLPIFTPSPPRLELVRDAFTEAGFLAVDRRPLKLHCTPLNANYRRPMPGQRRAPGGVPFSFAVFPAAGPNLGTWTVDELQIREIGRRTGLMCGSPDAIFGLSVVDMARERDPL
ncbi:hypothetical protein V8E53_010661 [Lactarius tabidus]